MSHRAGTCPRPRPPPAPGRCRSSPRRSCTVLPEVPRSPPAAAAETTTPRREEPRCRGARRGAASGSCRRGGAGGSAAGALLPVQRRDDRLEGGPGDGAVDAHAPEDPVADLALDVRGGQRVVALGERVLGVVEDAHVDLPLGQRLDEAVQRAVADPGDLVLLTVHHQGDGDAVRPLAGGLLAHVSEAEAAPAAVLLGRGEVLVAEGVTERLGAALAAVGVRAL